MLKMSWRAVIALSALAATAPALAWEEVSDADMCAIGDTWELGHTILISKSKSGSGGLSGEIMDDNVTIDIFNDDWKSLVKNDPPKEAEFTLRFEDEDGAWFSNQPYIVNNGLVMRTDLEGLGYLRNSNSVTVSKGKAKETVVELNWGLFFIELDKFKRCIEAVRAPIIEERRKARIRGATPIDPFATG